MGESLLVKILDGVYGVVGDEALLDEVGVVFKAVQFHFRLVLPGRGAVEREGKGRVEEG